MICHPIPPVWNEDARVLILGSFPSVRSREIGFFYGHPQNRFWRTVAAVFGEEIPASTEEKIALLHRRRIALWDVIASCEITGSADASIRNVTPNNLLPILHGAPIRHIVTNGKTADALYRRYQLPITGMDAVCLPSTSPANARFRETDLIRAWSVLAGFTDS
ncbi:MAG: DNA-deoxyinosine glycosylase [Clostridia bacterium]|nr:DNA-deoxyinosine glycosylase [Clostridia bacterium]